MNSDLLCRLTVAACLIAVYAAAGPASLVAADFGTMQGTENVFVPQLVMWDYVAGDSSPRVFHGKSEPVDRKIKQFIVDHGFSGFHVPVIGGRWFDLDAQSDRVESTMTDPDLRTFEALELLVTRTHEAGGLVHIWPWGDHSRSQTPRSLSGGIGGAVDERLRRYTAARLGPIPGWSMGFGFDLDEWVTAGGVANIRGIHPDLGPGGVYSNKDQTNRRQFLSGLAAAGATMGMPLSPVVAGLQEERIPSEEDIFRWIEEIFSLGIRRPAYPADLKTEDYCLEKFARWGLENVRREPVKLPYWRPEICRLEIQTGNHTELLPCFALPLCASQELVDVEIAHFREDAPEEVSGKISLYDVHLMRSSRAYRSPRLNPGLKDPERVDVLDLARYWSHLPVSRRPHRLLFLLNAGHMAGGPGTHAFVDNHRELLGNTVLAVHLDRSLILPPDAFAPVPTTDGGYFHLAQVPPVNFLTAPFYLFSSLDTLDKIHKPSLVSPEFRRM
ncbi:twin-arginine translocation signal domain-containing protein [Planctomycetota bacterium]